VITDVSDEILNSRIGSNSLDAMLSNRNTKMSRWLNKWIVPLLVAFVTLLTIAIAVFVNFAVHLLR
jgi:hypothetical protein